MTKKTIYYSLIAYLTLSNISCTHSFTEITNIASPTSNNIPLLTYFQRKVKESPEINNSIARLIKSDEELLWSHIETSHSGLYGNYFAIPLKNQEQEIHSCIVIPIIPQEDGGYSIEGELTHPFVLGENELSEIPEEFRYLFSLLFLQWQNRELNVSSQLTEYAETLYNNYIPRESQTQTRSIPGNQPCTIRYIVDYRIYDYTYGDGESVNVIQISDESLRKIFTEALCAFAHYQECHGGTIKNISPLIIDVRVDYQGHNQQIITHYMNTVESILWQKHNINKIEYQFHANIYPTWDPISGGNTGSGGGTGGGSSSGGSSSTHPPIIEDKGLYSNDYINNIYQDFSIRSKIFNKLQENFIKENSIVHLKWEYSDTLKSNEAGLLVSELDNYWLTIQLNKDVLRKYPPLCIAKTMIHELMHADVLVKLMSLRHSNPGTMTSDELESLDYALNKQNYPTLYYYYNKYLYNATSQHAYMSDYQVEVIAQALKEFIPNTDPEICEAIAWQGLQTMLVAKYNENENRWFFKEEATPGWERLGKEKQLQINAIYKKYYQEAPLGY